MKTLAGLLAFVTVAALGTAPALPQQWVDYPTVEIRKDWWWDEGWWNTGELDRPENTPFIEKQVSYMSGETEVPAILYRPAAPGAYPAVLFQHGRAGLIDWVQGHARRLAGRGFVVLAPDVYSGRFIDPRPIGHDYALEDDVSAGLTYLLGLDDVSTSRACLYSHTRGGYYTLKVAVAKGRQKDAAACYVSYYPHLQDPNLAEPMQVYRYATELDDLEIPTMIFIGENDQYQRRRSMETGVNAMLAKGRDVRLFVYPGVGRGFDFRPATVRTFADDLAAKDAIRRAELFMRRHLAPFRK